MQINLYERNYHRNRVRKRENADTMQECESLFVPLHLFIDEFKRFFDRLFTSIEHMQIFQKRMSIK